MVGIVISRAQHRAKIRAKKGCFTPYLALKGCVKAKIVCARTERLSVQCDIFQYHYMDIAGTSHVHPM
jgi:hypothetical protein